MILDKRTKDRQELLPIPMDGQQLLEDKDFQKAFGTSSQRLKELTAQVLKKAAGQSRDSRVIEIIHNLDASLAEKLLVIGTL